MPGSEKEARNSWRKQGRNRGALENLEPHRRWRDMENPAVRRGSFNRRRSHIKAKIGPISICVTCVRQGRQVEERLSSQEVSGAPVIPSEEYMRPGTCYIGKVAIVRLIEAGVRGHVIEHVTIPSENPRETTTDAWMIRACLRAVVLSKHRQTVAAARQIEDLAEHMERTAKRYPSITIIEKGCLWTHGVKACWSLTLRESDGSSILRRKWMIHQAGKMDCGICVTRAIPPPPSASDLVNTVGMKMARMYEHLMSGEDEERKTQA